MLLGYYAAMSVSRLIFGVLYTSSLIVRLAYIIVVSGVSITLLYVIEFFCQKIIKSFMDNKRQFDN